MKDLKDLKELENLKRRYPVLVPLLEKIIEAEEIMKECFENGGKLLLCGNGGSAADSDHIVGELMKEFHRERKIPEAFKEELQKINKDTILSKELRGALPAISLNSQPAIMTALLNDCDPSIVYAQQVYGYGKKEDVLFCMSTSGNAENVWNAAITAKALGMKVILLTGEKKGKICDIADVAIEIPETDTYQIQELTLPIYHALCIMIEDYFWG